jgi:aspartyl/asparaginyl-tRNA synthetase
VIAHDYESVDFATIWRSVTDDIPRLIAEIDSIERDIGMELYSDAEREANYKEIQNAIKEADGHGERGGISWN